MGKIIKIDRTYFIIGIFILFIVTYFIFLFFTGINNCKGENCDLGNIDINFGTNDDLEENYINDASQRNNLQRSEVVQSQHNNLNSRTVISKERADLDNITNTNNLGYTDSSTMVVDERTVNSLDRIYNPLRYPYKSDYYYERGYYPNLEIPFQALGCGGRRTPCLGGTQVPIYNPPLSIDISERNIAPVYVSTRGPLGKNQQLGVLYKIYGDDNDVLPLYGRKKYPNDTKYEYYTLMGRYGVKLPLIIKNKNDELGTNDVVFVKGLPAPYRVTIYESDFPSYIPYD